MTGFVQSLITIALFILILGVLVVIHEIGHFVTAKREEWLDYIKHVSPWEIDRYLGMY